MYATFKQGEFEKSNSPCFFMRSCCRSGCDFVKPRLQIIDQPRRLDSPTWFDSVVMLFASSRPRVFALIFSVRSCVSVSPDPE